MYEINMFDKLELRRSNNMDLLYHYASNQKGVGILKSKSIRLSDICKSNDYRELTLFFPDIFDAIFRSFKESPFEFKYEGKHGKEAMISLLDITEQMIGHAFDCGDFSNFVLCFSEKSDLLSQWRGYANDGQGISIGFSKDNLEKITNEDNSVLRLEKVIYISEEKRQQLIREKAAEVIETLKGLRKWIVDEMTHDDLSKDTDSLLGFNFHSMIEYILIESLKYKPIGFEEEKEWRLFLRDHAYKSPELVLGDERKIIGPKYFSETISFLRNNIEFNITDNDICPYIPLKFSEIGDEIIKEIWIGPKSKICKGDMELFLAQHNYQNIQILYSNTSYR